jgi:hypothetical protein
MKKIILFIAFLQMAWMADAQIQITDGTSLKVVSGGSMTITGDLASDNGTLDNQGTVKLKGKLENNTSALFSSTSSGTFIFEGSTQQVITGNADAGFRGTTVVNNASGVALTSASTGSSQSVNGELQLTSGKLILNQFDLNVASTDPTGAGASSYIVTNSTGSLKREVPADGATAVSFPVGNASYNPVVLSGDATATTDTYGVRVADNEPANAATDHFVDRSWVITEEVPGGSDLTVGLQWNGTEELNNFNSLQSAVGRVTAAGPAYEWKEFGVAAGGDPYSREGVGFTDVGTFAVGDINNIAVAGSFELRDSQGNLLPGGTLEYFDTEWRTATEISDGVFEVYTQATTVDLRMLYEGGIQQVDGVNVNDGYTYFTTLITAELFDSQGNGIEGGKAEYFTTEWLTLGTTDATGTATKELLPVTYSFRMIYAGGSLDVADQNTAIDPVVTFQTILVTVELKDSQGSGLAGGEVRYKNKGWKDFGTTDANGQVTGELLPATSTFEMSYAGGKQQIADWNTAEDATVTFQTIEVTVELLDDQGNGIQGGEAEYKTNGWQAFGTTDANGQATKELLPLTYSFRMYYNGDMDQVNNHDTGQDPVVTFYESDLKIASLDNPEFTVYPNPVVTTLSIAFELEKAEKVTLGIFDEHGKLLEVLVDDDLQEGIHRLTWDASPVSRGVYILRALVGQKLYHEKIVRQ